MSATKPRTWNGKPSPFWQHNEPIDCPEGHVMVWLGLTFWMCEACHRIYVQVPEKTG